MTGQLEKLIKQLLHEVKLGKNIDNKLLLSLQKRYLKNAVSSNSFFSKSEILQACWQLPAAATLNEQQKAQLRSLLQLKPVRSWSGVTVVTVLTKPWPCPGRCLFCPADVRMPKSYLANEPGAARAEANYFDPYLQVYSRLETLQAMGHNLEKIELIILGGSWDSYPLTYRLWFVKQLFTALNKFATPAGKRQFTRLHHFYQQLHFANESFISNNAKKNLATFASFQKKINAGTLSYNQFVRQCYLGSQREAFLAKKQRANWQQVFHAHTLNQDAKIRNVGLVIETRPDLISESTLLCNRRLGCTKIQMGVQTLNDKLLSLNQRDTRVEQIAQAFWLLRQFGFKIHVHMMANLLGANVASDLAAYRMLVTDERFIPDEIKLYPCALLESAPGLMACYQAGTWQPYTSEQLLYLLGECIKITPRYIRITRMIRDFSAHDIVAGNKKTNFRQAVEQQLQQQQISVKEIRSREIKRQVISLKQLQLTDTSYFTQNGKEHFLEYHTADEHIVGFLRLSLPQGDSDAMIREVHVYGEAQKLGSPGESQHLGLGKKLIAHSESIAKKHGYARLRVISAVGTRGYYRERGFSDDKLYQEKVL